MRTDEAEGRRARSRRAVLAGAGSAALGIAAVAAASGCGTAEPAGAPPTGAGTPSGGGHSNGTHSNGIAPNGSGGGGAGATGTVLGPASEVPVSGGKIFESLEVVVTQPKPDDFRGFSTICTHTACNVAEVAGGTINCPCHGSKYHLDGTVARGPAPRPLPSRPVRVVNGQIILS
jgi:Rieske Fe-S protein